jgi:hypothetical protein
MKVTLFFGSLLANQLLGRRHSQVPGRFDHANAYGLALNTRRTSRPTGVAVSVKH